jgi:hypothetical protein
MADLRRIQIMTCLNPTHRFAFVTLALLASAGAVVAAEQVPLRGTLSGTQHRTPLEPPFVLDVFEMAGTATQLGQFQLLITATVNTATRTATGTYEFVAANGDTLTATFTGRSAPTATPGVILIVETATITGGTGRFAGATGSFVVERLFNIATGQTEGAIDGVISTVGSGKP